MHNHMHAYIQFTHTYSRDEEEDPNEEIKQFIDNGIAKTHFKPQQLPISQIKFTFSSTIGHFFKEKNGWKFDG